jgi:DNA modification methylase
MGKDDRLCVMEVQMRQIEALQADPSNVREHDQRNIDAIKASLTRFGQQKPIVVDADGVVVAGNGTLGAAKLLGWSEIAVVETGLKNAEAVAFAIADNRTAELAAWDDQALTLVLDQLDADQLEATGFTDDDLVELMGSLAPDVRIEEDEAPEPPEDPITQPGDLWMMGEHRLFCGDSTNRGDVKRLMDGGVADIMFTSPPYNLGKSSKISGNKNQEERGDAYVGIDDDVSPEKWRSMVESMVAASLEVSHAAIVNVQPLAGNKSVIWKWLANIGSRLCDVLIWDKGFTAPAFAPGVTSSSYELLVVIGGENAKRTVPFASWRGTVSNIYRGDLQRANKYAAIHGASFPAHLPEFVLGTLCDKSKSVYDCCMGTGTTLVVAEQLGRKCYGMEISPAYCDVIVQRWENLTGEKAVRQPSSDEASGNAEESMME